MTTARQMQKMEDNLKPQLRKMLGLPKHTKASVPMLAALVLTAETQRIVERIQNDA